MDAAKAEKKPVRTYNCKHTRFYFTVKARLEVLPVEVGVVVGVDAGARAHALRLWRVLQHGVRARHRICGVAEVAWNLVAGLGAGERVGDAVERARLAAVERAEDVEVLQVNVPEKQ